MQASLVVCQVAHKRLSLGEDGAGRRSRSGNGEDEQDGTHAEDQHGQRQRIAFVQEPTSSHGFIEPCLPSPADKPPSGSNWIHEIKHDGYRLMALRDPVGIRLHDPQRS
jgi:ATP-dependent DNA ligase